MCMAALFAVAMLTEWWPIVVVRDSAHIASRSFGSSLMMRQGGWRYANPEVYAWTAFAEAFAATLTMPVLWLTIVRRSRKAATALAVVCATYVVASLVLGQINWTPRATLAGLPTKRPTKSPRTSQGSNARAGIGSCRSRPDPSADSQS